MQGVSLAAAQAGPPVGAYGDTPPPVLVVEQSSLPPGEIVVNEVATQPPQVLAGPGTPPQQRVLGDAEVPQDIEAEFDSMRHAWQLSFLQVPDSGNHGMRMAGGELSYRLRNRNLGIDFGLGYLHGDDKFYQLRSEVPISWSFLWFFNPYDTFQFYARLGVGLAFVDVGAPADGVTRTVDLEDRGFSYVTFTPGFGIEWRPVPGLGLGFDLRPNFRMRTDSNPALGEYVEIDGTGNPTGYSTNPVWMLMYGVTATFYSAS